VRHGSHPADLTGGDVNERRSPDDLVTGLDVLSVVTRRQARKINSI
jgi:hypothetical protein